MFSMMPIMNMVEFVWFIDWLFRNRLINFAAMDKKWEIDNLCQKLIIANQLLIEHALQDKLICLII